MTEAATPEAPGQAKSSKMPLIAGVVLALVGGAGGYFATSTGLLFAPESKIEAPQEEMKTDKGPAVAFIPMDPIAISLPPSSPYRQLRFRAELEVVDEYASEVEKVMPRVIDVLNTYLRAVEVADLEAPASLTRLRSQMLRRVQVVAGPGRVNDLLVMEFVLN